MQTFEGKDKMLREPERQGKLRKKGTILQKLYLIFLKGWQKKLSKVFRNEDGIVKVE